MKINDLDNYISYIEIKQRLKENFNLDISISNKDHARFLLENYRYKDSIKSKLIFETAKYYLKNWRE